MNFLSSVPAGAAVFLSGAAAALGVNTEDKVCPNINSSKTHETNATTTTSRLSFLNFSFMKVGDNLEGDEVKSLNKTWKANIITNTFAGLAFFSTCCRYTDFSTCFRYTEKKLIAGRLINLGLISAIPVSVYIFTDAIKNLSVVSGESKSKSKPKNHNPRELSRVVEAAFWMYSLIFSSIAVYNQFNRGNIKALSLPALSLAIDSLNTLILAYNIDRAMIYKISIYEFKN